MYGRVALTCCFVVAVASAQTTSTTIRPSSSTRVPLPSSFTSSLQGMVNNVSNGFKGGIAMVNSTAQLGGQLATQGVSGITGAIQQASNTVTGLKSTALQGGVNLFKAGVDVGTSFANLVPFLGTAANMGGSMIKAGADMANSLGQATIGVGSGIVNGKLSLVNGAVSTGAGLVTQGVNMGTSMATQGVDMGANMANSAIASAGSALDAAVGTMDQMAQSVSSMAANAANSVSSSVGGTGSASLQAAFGK